jgi:hypothetical protein
MAITNTLAHYKTEKRTLVKSFIADAPEEEELFDIKPKIIFADNVIKLFFSSPINTIGILGLFLLSLSRQL